MGECGGAAGPSVAAAGPSHGQGMTLFGRVVRVSATRARALNGGGDGAHFAAELERCPHVPQCGAAADAVGERARTPGAGRAPLTLCFDADALGGRGHLDAAAAELRAARDTGRCACVCAMAAVRYDAQEVHMTCAPAGAQRRAPKLRAYHATAGTRASALAAAPAAASTPSPPQGERRHAWAVGARVSYAGVVTAVGARGGEAVLDGCVRIVCAAQHRACAGAAGERPWLRVGAAVAVADARCVCTGEGGEGVEGGAGTGRHTCARTHAHPIPDASARALEAEDEDDEEACGRAAFRLPMLALTAWSSIDLIATAPHALAGKKPLEREGTCANAHARGSNKRTRGGSPRHGALPLLSSLVQPLPDLARLGCAAVALPTLLGALACVVRTLEHLGMGSERDAIRKAWTVVRAVYKKELGEGGVWRGGDAAGSSRGGLSGGAPVWPGLREAEDALEMRALAALEHEGEAPRTSSAAALARAACEVANARLTRGSSSLASRRRAREAAALPVGGGADLLGRRNKFPPDATGRARALVVCGHELGALVVARLVALPAGCVGLEDGSGILRVCVRGDLENAAIGHMYALRDFDVLVEAAPIEYGDGADTCSYCFGAPVLMCDASALLRVAVAKSEEPLSDLAWARAPMVALGVVMGHGTVAGVHASASPAHEHASVAGRVRVHRYLPVMLASVELRPTPFAGSDSEGNATRNGSAAGSGGGDDAAPLCRASVHSCGAPGEALELVARCVPREPARALVCLRGPAAALSHTLVEGALVAISLDEQSASVGRWPPDVRLCHIDAASALPREVAVRAASAWKYDDGIAVAAKGSSAAKFSTSAAGGDSAAVPATIAVADSHVSRVKAELRKAVVAAAQAAGSARMGGWACTAAQALSPAVPLSPRYGTVRGVVMHKELGAPVAAPRAVHAQLHGSAGATVTVRHPLTLTIATIEGGAQMHVRVGAHVTSSLPPGCSEGALVHVCVRAVRPEGEQHSGQTMLEAIDGGVMVERPCAWVVPSAACGLSVRTQGDAAGTAAAAAGERLARLAPLVRLVGGAARAPDGARVRCSVAALRRLDISLPHSMQLARSHANLHALQVEACALLDDGSACAEVVLSGEDAWCLFGVGSAARRTRNALEAMARQGSGLFVRWTTRDARSAHAHTAGGALGGAQLDACASAARIAAATGAEVAANVVWAGGFLRATHAHVPDAAREAREAMAAFDL